MIKIHTCCNAHHGFDEEVRPPFCSHLGYNCHRLRVHFDSDNPQKMGVGPDLGHGLVERIRSDEVEVLQNVEPHQKGVQPLGVVSVGNLGAGYSDCLEFQLVVPRFLGMGVGEAHLGQEW